MYSMVKSVGIVTQLTIDSMWNNYETQNNIY